VIISLILFLQALSKEYEVDKPPRGKHRLTLSNIF